MSLRDDAYEIINQALEVNMPQTAVREALAGHTFAGGIYLAAIGKAAWTMAKAAADELGGRIKKGVVITKYNHSLGDIPGLDIIEAGHPLPDENTVKGTRLAVEMAETLGKGDELLFLISGGGSALFEEPLPGASLNDIICISNRLLSCGADIVEINTIRKRLSAVKAGRFARTAAPAKVFAVVLSDVLGDRLDSIASGPAAPDMSTSEDAGRILKKYGVDLNPAIRALIDIETPKTADNVETVITGSVSKLCLSVANAAKNLGYTPYILCTNLNCEAREAGRFAASLAARAGCGLYGLQTPCAIILGGETVVHVKGAGKGGRNQELALAAAEGISGMKDTLIFSFGSDGTDGPTDAAGGMADGGTAGILKDMGINISDALDKNDAYNALKAAGGLIITGPTGTNVNDAAVILKRN